MAKNFNNAGANKAFAEVAAKAEEKAKVITLVNISTENLLDNPNNGEDISVTDDLEVSMRQVGFTDPIEVTDYGMEDGKYMILSGHRRRAAGVKVGITVFPAVVRHFSNEQEVQNYTLLSNSQRDSSKDPFLFSKRYKMHEQYLKDSGFSGSIRDEVAKRLGLSTQQADRYNAMNRVILPVWDMVRAEQVAMSAVTPLAAHSEAEQEAIYAIMQEAQKQGMTLTRDRMKQIVDGYRAGKTTWAEIADLPRDSGLPMNPFINDEPGESRDEGEHDRSNEVEREYDPIAAEADKMDEMEAEYNEQNQNPENPDGEEMSEEEKKIKRGQDICKTISKLETLMTDFFSIGDEGVDDFIAHVGSVVGMLIDESFNIAEEKDRIDVFQREMKSAKKSINDYSKYKK